ncbi:subtilisin-like protein [Hesseltinella vesiculosa]|uniref:Subtilisin-like protein n=1 Tax=Hesseltinella vesiculosa TaxID=101127 RepID=A0A1X2GPH8_9FUNG|nr:subtilisin-like protein [Hesseltinella vesiculosa]
MKPAFSLIQLFTVASLALQGAVDASVSHSKLKRSSNPESILSNSYIIELASTDSVASFSSLFTKTFSKDVTINHEFNHRLFSGLTVTINDPHAISDQGIHSAHDNLLASLFDHHHVVSVHQNSIIPRPKVASVQPLYTSGQIANGTFASMMPHALTQVDRVHKELNNTGRGVVIGIIDTGVDYMLPALGGGFGPGYKIRYGEDLAGDNYQPGGQTYPSPTPLANCPLSTNDEGHGTHVTGIIGAKTDGFTGVAPDATLGHWRVFGCGTGTAMDIVMKAMLLAHDAGCDVINMSLGQDGSWSETPVSVLASKFAEEGIFMSISAGNSGAQGAFTVGTPAAGINTTSVAAIDNTHNLVDVLSATGFSKPIIIAPGYEYLTNPNGTVVLGDNNVGSGHDACNASSIPADVKGNWALIQKGGCSYDSRVTLLQAAGSIGLIAYDTVDIPVPPSSNTHTFPVLKIGKSDGLAMVAALKAGKKVDVTFTGIPEVVPVDTGMTVSWFSSVGATYELDLRPNVAGIGGNVLSTFPRTQGGWGILSGTSMASPYVAASAGLYISSLGNTTRNVNRPSPSFILEQLQNSAYKVPSVNGQANLDTTIRQGAGLVQVYDSITRKVHISPGQISFNDTASGNNIQTITITNNGPTTVAYTISNNASLSVSPYDFAQSGYAFTEPINYTSDAATLRITPNNVKVPAGGSVQVQVSVIPPATDPKLHIMYGGYVQLKSSAPDVIDMSLPYFGVAGLERDLPIFDVNYPYLSNDSSGNSHLPTNTTISFPKKGSNLYMVTRFVTATQLVRYELLDGTTSLVLGNFLNDGIQIIRNYLDAGLQYYAQAWDGTYITPTNATWGPPPAGTYRLKVSALKVFGNPNLPTDFETWTSGLIQLN